MILGGMVSSSVLVEDVFNWPGLGNQLVQAIASQDYGVVQGIALVYAAFILVVNLVVDICVALIDPRNTLMDTG
jgi:peptide/nickel transport system permease protein